MREPFAHSFFFVYALALLAFLLYGFLAIRFLFKRGRLGLLGFALLFPWLMFMTEFSTVRIQEEFVLYRSYLWAVGGFALLPLIVWKITARGAMLMLGVVAAFMFVVSMERLSTFSHPFLLWNDAEKLVHGRSDLPGEYRIYYNRGTEYLKLDRYDDAIRDLKYSLKLYGDQPAAYGNLGAAYIKKGDFEDALKTYNLAIQIGLKKKARIMPKHYLGRAMANEALKNWAAASADYKVTCRLIHKGCDKTNLAVTRKHKQLHMGNKQ
jgi:tetratricopeptide (TPR) repeat protein